MSVTLERTPTPQLRELQQGIGMPWERVDIVTGRTDLHLPIASPQDGANSIFTNTRTFYGAAGICWRR